MQSSGEEFPGRPKENRAGSDDRLGDMTGADKDARGPAPDDTGKADQPKPKDMRERPQPQHQPQHQAQPPKARRPRWPVPLALLGVLAIVLAAILGSANRARAQLPTDFNASRQFSGTATSLLNPTALQNGNFGAALMANVPVTGQQTVRVLASSGDNARVLNERTLMADGTEIGTTSDTFAVNRNSMEPASTPPADWNAQQAQGLTVGFPAGAERRDYSAWVADTQSTTPLRFLREESRGGVNTFVYQAEVAPTPIRDQSVLSSLPTSLTRAALAGITPSLPITDEQRASLLQAMPGLPDQVPVNYTFQGTTTYWVEPTTGQVVDQQRDVIRSGAIGGPGGSTLGTLPVFNVSTRFTDDSVAAAGREAADRRNSLDNTGRVWPWVLGTLGALAVIAGVLGMLARRRPQPATGPRSAYTPPDRTPRGGGSDATGTARQNQAGRPQAPYTGTTPHTGPYRESPTGQPSATNEEPQSPPGQSPGGRQPPKKSG
jgi:hypothetical protein